MIAVDPPVRLLISPLASKGPSTHGTEGLAIKAPVALRHVDGFPALGLLRPLRRHGPRSL